MQQHMQPLLPIQNALKLQCFVGCIVRQMDDEHAFFRVFCIKIQWNHLKHLQFSQKGFNTFFSASLRKCYLK